MGLRRIVLILHTLSLIHIWDIGFDRSLIGAYGHDDRVCAYTALMATLEAEKPAHTVLTVLADREEIGSCGVTGMKSDFFMNFLEDLCDGFGISVRRVLDKSRCLSADVSVAYDPSFPCLLYTSWSCW